MSREITNRLAGIGVGDIANNSATTVADETALRPIIGKVASPPMKEATSEEFHFWIPRGVMGEKGQMVRTDWLTANRSVQYYAIVDEVYRQSRKKNIGEEYDTFDGDTGYEPEFTGEGVRFATATI